MELSSLIVVGEADWGGGAGSGGIRRQLTSVAEMCLLHVSTDVRIVVVLFIVNFNDIIIVYFYIFIVICKTLLYLSFCIISL